MADPLRRRPSWLGFLLGYWLPIGVLVTLGVMFDVLNERVPALERLRREPCDKLVHLGAAALLGILFWRVAKVSPIWGLTDKPALGGGLVALVLCGVSEMIQADTLRGHDGASHFAADAAGIVGAAMTLLILESVARGRREARARRRLIQDVRARALLQRRTRSGRGRGP